MLKDSEYNQLKQEASRLKDASLIKKSKMEERRNHLAQLRNQIVELGILTPEELEHDDMVSAKIEQMEIELLNYVKKLKTIV